VKVKLRLSALRLDDPLNRERWGNLFKVEEGARDQICRLRGLARVNDL
jgi:hypothetical protein